MIYTKHPDYHDPNPVVLLIPGIVKLSELLVLRRIPHLTPLLITLGCREWMPAPFQLLQQLLLSLLGSFLQTKALRLFVLYFRHSRRNETSPCMATRTTVSSALRGASSPSIFIAFNPWCSVPKEQSCHVSLCAVPTSTSRKFWPA